MIDEAWARQEVVDTAQAMSAKGLSPQRSGNVSVRIENAILVTPTGLPYADYLPSDMVKMALDGKVSEGQKKPSSEAPFHLAIYKAFPEAVENNSSWENWLTSSFYKHCMFWFHVPRSYK